MQTERSLAVSYARWRASRLGRLTDAIETREILRRCPDLMGKRVLDVGCGDGFFFSIAFAAAGALVTGVDADIKMLGIAQANAAGKGVDVAFLQADGRKLPYNDGSFDIVAAIAVLCLVQDRPAFVAEMARVLRPGGRLVIGELGAWSMWNAVRRVRGALGAHPWRDAHFFTAAELRSLLSQPGLVAASVTGAVYYPPHPFIAVLVAPLDAWFARVGTLGAAFLVASAGRRS